MKQFLEMEECAEKKFWGFEQKRLKLEHEQEERRLQEEAKREERQRHLAREPTIYVTDDGNADEHYADAQQIPQFAYQNTSFNQPYIGWQQNATTNAPGSSASMDYQTYELLGNV